MADDTIPLRSNGQTITDSWYNVLNSALNGDLVPRDTSGVATDAAGSLGNATYRWLSAYFMAQYLFNGTNKTGIIPSPSTPADYILTLMSALPGARRMISSGTDGQLITSITEDGVTTEISGDTLRIKDGGITIPKMTAFNYQLSSSCGAFSFSTVETQVTNFSLSITSTGRPIWLGVIPDGNLSGNKSSIYAQGGAAAPSTFTWKRDGVRIAGYDLGTLINMPVGSLLHVDPVAAGTYIYTLTAQTTSAGTANIEYAKMIVFER